ncbi:hypothetical protein E4T56_gene11683 [Termitomyces sp. T112]|nr:hypothetical protein E4T56_gene11683 [Termitomyces sp. T112]
MVGMTVSALAVASTSDTTKHPVDALAVVRREEQSKGHGGKEKADCGDIQEGPSTPKAAAGGVARSLATLPRLVTTLRSKGKGKGKAQEEDNEDIEAFLAWQKKNNIGEGDWEEEDLVDVPDDDANLDA